MYCNIPSELKALDQWVVCGDDKKPFDPKTGLAASPTDPATWSSFETAVSRNQKIGFVLSSSDPYCIIDLDNKPANPATPEQLERQQQILNHFQTYTEKSTSGTGYHIVVKGRIPSGVNRDHVEMYSDSRFMIFTGDVVKALPIAEGYQDTLLAMFGQMSTQSTTLEQVDSDILDRDVVEMAMRASNAAKFNSLCKGEMSEYGSQSEADFALLSIIAFYTKDNEQVRRIFRMTALGKRDKATRDDKYINRSLKKIRANEPPPIDFSALKQQAAKIIEQEEPEEETKVTPVTFPPGLIGEIAEYIYATAIRPVPEIALSAAIAFGAGIVGRSYNISGTGLNQYILLLAQTGTGKEGAANGIDKIISAVRQTVPVVDQFVGPAGFASGQAILRTLDESPAFVSILGEFGLTLKQLCSPRANGGEILLKRVLLDLYTKSGWDKVLRSTAYADKEKNTKVIQAPNLSILGESTPETFYDGLASSHISEGLIPRFTIIEYKGDRPPRNPNGGGYPTEALTQKIADLITVALTTTSNNICCPIAIDENAATLLDEFDTMSDAKINKANVIERHLWNRAHLKALKLAGLIAVGCDKNQPMITGPAAQWAIAFITKEIIGVATRFANGDVGTGDNKQEFETRRVIKEYLKGGYKRVSGYGIHKQMYVEGLIPLSYLSARLRNLSAFQDDRRGPAFALRATLLSMVENGALIEIDAKTTAEKYKRGGKVYGIGVTP